MGRSCRALTLSVVYQNCALPWAWHVARGSRGHFSQVNHIELIDQIAPLIPKMTKIVFLGDGEFDGTQLLSEIDEYGFNYVCRTTKDTLITQKGKTFTFEELNLKPGIGHISLNVAMTTEQYPRPQAIGVWEEDFDIPIYLVSNLSVYDDPLGWYQLRFCIETFFPIRKVGDFICIKVISLPQSELRY